MNPSTAILANDHGTLAALVGKTFLITGANGMLGSAFKTQLQRMVPTATVHAFGKDELDVRLPVALAACEVLKPDIVLHCAALVDADRCEDEPDEGRASIVEGTRNVVEFSRRCGARLLYPQSFLIYDGVEPLIDEQTVPRPLGTYGHMKLEAEQLALRGSDTALSVRMAGFFGGASVDKNFVGRIIPHFAKLIRQGTASIDIGNRVWQPTYTDDLAANSLLLLAAQRNGIYCMASHGSASFHELAAEIVRLLGLAGKLKVRCVDAEGLSSKERAKRPASAIMRNLRLQAEGLDRQRPWQLALAEYLDQPYFKELFQ